MLSSTPPASSPPSYSSPRIVQLPTVCRSESCANNLTKLVDLLVASYLLSSTLLAYSSTSYSSRPTCYHPRRRHPHRHRTRRVVLYNFPPSVALRTELTISRSSSIFSPRLTCYHPRRRPPHRHPTRRVLLAIIHAAGILKDIVLVASYLLSSTPPASSSTSYSSRPTCYHPRRRHPHRHPHCHRTRRALLVIVLAAGILIGILFIDVAHCVVSHPANCLCYCHAERCYLR